MTSASTGEREHDLIVFGATGFVGRLVAAYLAGRAPDGLRVALAGRSAERLDRVRSELGGADGWATVVADSSGPEAMARLAASTSVVATTVGPYIKYGGPLVEACARSGTHYADLTGEVLFVRRSVERCHGPASESGARIVHSCGYDSIPSDLGALLLHERAQADDRGSLGLTTLVAKARGGFSGGTIDSMRQQLQAMGDDRAARAIVEDPYALSPDRSADPDGRDEPDPTGGHHDPQAGTWLAPFVMAPYNTRIVRRSNALLDHVYGPGFRYQEYMAAGDGPVGALAAHSIGVGMKAFMAAMSFPPSRMALDRILPAPGTGPSEQARQRGWYRSELHTTTDRGVRYQAVVAGTGDPGYAGTAVMFGESALCLTGTGLPDRVGVLTPATAMGDALIGRLRAAGLTLEVNPVSGAAA